MLSNSRGSILMIFLVTVGPVKDERNICHCMQNDRQIKECYVHPSIHTFGIVSIEVQMNKLFSKGVSTVLANSTIDAFDDHEEIEVLAKRQLDLLTAQTWFSEHKRLKKKACF
ncbi:uncharacterized protein [Gossypium hirsutum]|uniref:Uncharacterized protein n=3 Tax=Gossypium TaxID=3633 RepID=A0ABM3BH63_GOSHI|nr:uncharacterized protein LOC107942568 [Gossypium hirsutum]